MNNLAPTRGQLERKISQSIQALYSEHLGHQPSKVICHLSDKNLTIILENSITPPEQLLSDEGQNDLAKEVRSNLDEVFKPKLQEMIESILEIKVADLLSDSTIETGRVGIVVILEQAPVAREPASKVKPKKAPSQT